MTSHQLFTTEEVALPSLISNLSPIEDNVTFGWGGGGGELAKEVEFILCFVNNFVLVHFCED